MVEFSVCSSPPALPCGLLCGMCCGSVVLRISALLVVWLPVVNFLMTVMGIVASVCTLISWVLSRSLPSTLSYGLTDSQYLSSWGSSAIVNNSFVSNGFNSRYGEYMYLLITSRTADGKFSLFANIWSSAYHSYTIICLNNSCRRSAN